MYSSPYHRNIRNTDMINSGIKQNDEYQRFLQQNNLDPWTTPKATTPKTAKTKYMPSQGNAQSTQTDVFKNVKDSQSVDTKYAMINDYEYKPKTILEEHEPLNWDTVVQTYELSANLNDNVKIADADSDSSYSWSKSDSEEELSEELSKDIRESLYDAPLTVPLTDLVSTKLQERQASGKEGKEGKEGSEVVTMNQFKGLRQRFEQAFKNVKGFNLSWERKP